MLRLLAIAAVCLVVVAPTAHTQTRDTTAFRVDSYIPDYFRDLELRVTGNAYLTGNQQEYRPQDPSAGRDMVDHNERWLRADVTGNTTYESRTKDRNLLLSSRLASQVIDHTLNGQRSDYQPSPSSQYRRSSRDYTTWYSDLRLEAQMDNYLAGDMFVSSRLRYDMRYRTSLDDERHDLLDRTSVDSAGNMTRTIDDDLVQNDDDSKTHAVSGQLGAGFGRMYDGRYATTALDLVEQARKAGLLQREPTFEEMTGLSELVFYWRNKHAVDSRLHRQEALDDLLAYLHSSGVIPTPGPHGTLLIQDVWDYFPNSSRNFGKRITISVGADCTRESAQNTRKTTYYTWSETLAPDSTVLIPASDARVESHSYSHPVRENVGFFTAVAIDYNYPVNRRWQLDAHGHFNYYLNAYNQTSANVRTDTDDSYLLSTDLSSRYQYDSRTSATMGIHYDRGRSIRNRSSYLPDDGLSSSDTWNASSTFRLDYRVAVPTTLFVRFNYAWQDTEYDRPTDSSSHRTNYSVQLGFEHWIL
ncbi:MAG: hypothetical protein KKA42_03970 [candidate division Zixibacteria bacterium]|nr:hypothetical protein [candidate division Zixibacteria bacterium]